MSSALTNDSASGALAPDAAQPRPLRPGPIVVAMSGRGGAGPLRVARALAPRFGDDVTVLAALEPLPVYFGPADLTRVPPELEHDRRAGLLEVVRRQVRNARAPEAPWPVEVRSGDAAFTVADAARDRGAALLVVGLGRHGPLERIFTSETTLRVLQHASCPVLAVPGGFGAEAAASGGADAGAPAAWPRTVVVATDFSASSAHAAEVALSLMPSGGTLHLVHAWDAAAAAGLVPGGPRVSQQLDAYARAIPAHFERLRGALPARPDVTVTTAVVEGRAAVEVLAYADAHAADLVAAGRRGHGLLGRVLVGSVTTALVRGAARPLLVTPPASADVDRLERVLTGASEGADRGAWRAELDAFTQRNAGRRTILTSDDPRRGAELHGLGYALGAAAFDPGDGRITVTLDAGGGWRLTHAFDGAERVTVLRDRAGVDLVLRVHHGGGRTELAFYASDAAEPADGDAPA